MINVMNINIIIVYFYIIEDWIDLDIVNKKDKL